jgi:DNA processing protein
MLTTLDAVALSTLYEIPRTKLSEALHDFCPPGTGQADDGMAGFILDAVLERVGAAQGIRPDTLRDRANRQLEVAKRLGIEVLKWGDPYYPPLLAAIPDPPVVLWVRGQCGVLGRLSVAIVGSRIASDHGLQVAEKLARDLATLGIVVVSGLARGVDSAAHRGALLSSGATVAVFGCGVDIVYPHEHRALAEDVLAGCGALVSEFPPGQRPLAWHFPLRNRIISGLSSGVVVVEASERSGSLITADCALEQGREVMAVPGNVLSGRSRGAHALLKAGAAVVETAEDVMDALGLLNRTCRLEAPPGQAKKGADDIVLANLVEGEPCDIERLAVLCKLPVESLLARLAELELEGQVRRVGGGRFVRQGGTC